MHAPLPDHLFRAAQEVEAAIRSAFRGVTREGGISWIESESIDLNWCQRDERARTNDKEQSWEILLDDPNWCHESGIGGFNFLDAIGYRYYIAPAMIRCMRDRSGEFTAYALTIDGDFAERRASAINPGLAAAIACFLRFMCAVHSFKHDHIYGEIWRDAYIRHWRQFDPGSESY